MTDAKQLLGWVAAIIKREQEAGAWGQIVVTLEQGKVVRVRSERVERPPTERE
jgi:hypothetical protein